MADNDTNDMEQFITGRLDFTTGTPPVGNTGNMEQFVTGHIDLQEFTKAGAPPVVGGPVLTMGAGYATMIG